jgi:hypothetical protein
LCVCFVDLCLSFVLFLLAIIPVKVPLGGGWYAELTEWNGSKRVDLRFWKTDTIPTKVGVN